MAWKVVYEVNGRKSFNNSKLKASREKDRIFLWQKHIQELLGDVITITTNEDELPLINKELNKFE